MDVSWVGLLVVRVLWTNIRNTTGVERSLVDVADNHCEVRHVSWW